MTCCETAKLIITVTHLDHQITKKLHFPSFIALLKKRSNHCLSLISKTTHIKALPAVISSNHPCICKYSIKVTRESPSKYREHLQKIPTKSLLYATEPKRLSLRERFYEYDPIICQVFRSKRETALVAPSYPEIKL